MQDLLNYLFGLELSSSELTLFHFMFRAFLVYFIGMFLVRIQGQFMGINTTFNFMLNFIVGSLLANGIVGEASFFAVLGMCLTIGIMNWIIAFLCYNFTSAEKLFKGNADLLVKDGRIIWKNMRKNLITKDELMEAVHKFTQSDDLSKVKKAYFENSDQITVITK